MFGKKRAVVDAESLRRVVNLIPEYVDALVDERRTRMAHDAGLDARESHGPAERKLKKVEGRIAELLGENGHKKHKEAQKGLRCSEVRKIFLSTTEKQPRKAEG